MPGNQPDLITPKEAYELLRPLIQNIATVRNWIKNNKVKYVKIGGRFFLSKTEIEKMIRI